MEFRLLRADEIDVRVGGITDGKGGYLLLYKDARCDMNILDESVGASNWQRGHELIDGQLFSNVSIYDEDKKEWITKQDVGVESYTEKEKGRASDSFKRACVNWGIGRELYTAPFIWISDKSANKNTWRYKKFRVTHIAYDDKKKISELAIEEQAGRGWKEVFRHGAKPFKGNKLEPQKPRHIKQDEVSKDDISKLWQKVQDMKGQFPTIEDDFKNAMSILLGQDKPTFDGIKKTDFTFLSEWVDNIIVDFEREQTDLWGKQHG